MSARPTRYDPAKYPQRAGILSNDMQFRRYVGMLHFGAGHDVTPEAAAEHIRRTCKIKSRRDLACNESARLRFDNLETEFDAWRGKIGTHR